VLALAAVDAVGVVLFGTLYAMAGIREMGSGLFLTCLAVLFALVTALWVRAEWRHRELDVLRRIGRVTLGLAVVVLAAPPLVLMPLFWLDSQLPPEAGLRSVLAPAMAILLIALVLVALVNVVGSVLVAAWALLSGRRRAAG
jgi:hypothetical protein